MKCRYFHIRVVRWLYDIVALHLFCLLRVDLDGVDSVLMDASLVEVSTVTELLLFINDLCAIRHYCGGRNGNSVTRFYKSPTSKTTW